MILLEKNVELCEKCGKLMQEHKILVSRVSYRKKL